MKQVEGLRNSDWELESKMVDLSKARLSSLREKDNQRYD